MSRIEKALETATTKSREVTRDELLRTILIQDYQSPCAFCVFSRLGPGLSMICNNPSGKFYDKILPHGITLLGCDDFKADEPKILNLL